MLTTVCAEIRLGTIHFLAEQLKELSLVDLDFDLEATGFEMGEIDLRIESLSADTAEEEDPADTLQIENAGPAVVDWEIYGSSTVT